MILTFTHIVGLLKLKHWMNLQDQEAYEKEQQAKLDAARNQAIAEFYAKENQ